MNTPRDVVMAFWEAIQSNDFTKTSLLLAEAYVLHYPQSNETFHGRDTFVRLNSDYLANGHWQFTVHRLLAEGTQVVSDVSVTDGMVEARVLTFSTVENGRISAQLEFWPEPFEVPGWRRSGSNRD